MEKKGESFDLSEILSQVDVALEYGFTLNLQQCSDGQLHEIQELAVRQLGIKPEEFRSLVVRNIKTDPGI